MSERENAERVKDSDYFKSGEVFDVYQISTQLGVPAGRAYGVARYMVTEGDLLAFGDKRYKKRSMSHWLRRKWV